MIRARFDRFAVAAYRRDERLRRRWPGMGYLPYLPLMFLGIPFGTVGVYVMIAVSVVASIALPIYGKRVSRQRKR